MKTRGMSVTLQTRAALNIFSVREVN